MTLDGDEAKALATADDLDYQEIGFRCGLEIHQQLDTRKLFSPCPSGVADPETIHKMAVAQYDRRLRATQSELGESDPAVLAEIKRRRSFRYLALDGLTSLVELDEEPPHPMSEEALDVTLTFAGLLGAKPASEVHVMRKTVIDGSNTSGFQRTALVATGGMVEPAHGTDKDWPAVGTWTIAVEEDSARKAEDAHHRVVYTLDRLGIPLIEVATAPDIVDPMHAQATAARLGALLRATGRVKRGLGSIRQDLNVSIGVGDRVEIKGCQDLRAVPDVIDKECRRQLWMHHIAQTLTARGFGPGDIGDVQDVSEAFADCDSKMVQSALKRGHQVLALPLGKWAGLIAGPAKDGPRMGVEFAAHAKVRAGVKGIFHSDELPAYGIGEEEVAAVRTRLGSGDDDAFILCVEATETARSALDAVAERAADAITAGAKEVRVAQPDGTTRYMRPLPGAARMYPETDVPPIPVADEHWQHILSELPARPEERMDALTSGGLSADLARQLVRSDRDGRYTDLVAGGMAPSLAGRVLTQLVDGLQHPDAVVARLPEVAQALADGAFAKEGVEAVLKVLDEAPDRALKDAIQAAGAAAADDSEVDDIIRRVVDERIDFVKERGMGAMGPLMGPVMAELRGKADGATISARLKAAIENALQ